jgi:NAD(P)-dependent dehydrogenase (short-subunit alcohol dehydrogenase family)
MNQKNCLITGGNAGIGKQAAIQLAKSGFKVFLGVRNLERGEKALQEIKEFSKSKDVELLELDLSSQNSILTASSILKTKIQKLDVLIHNAAEFDISKKNPEKSKDGIESIWATNHLGSILLTHQLLSWIKKSKQGRIITIASQGLMMYPKLSVDLNDPEFKIRSFSVPKAYYQSKLAQIMFTYWLADILKGTSITVNCIRVTNVKIDISRYPNVSSFMKFLYSIKSRFSISADEMAKTYTYLATSPELNEITGAYFNEKFQKVSSSSYSLNLKNIDAVMKCSLSYFDEMVFDRN